MKKIGKTIIRDGAYPEKHEFDTAWFLNKCGYDVEFLAPVDKDHVKTPDIQMNGILWEMKAPKGAGKYTFQHSFKDALRQSQNIIFDLRRNTLHEDRCINKIENLFKMSKRVKRLIIITQSKKILDFKK
jgi:hypothetical protein